MPVAGSGVARALQRHQAADQRRHRPRQRVLDGEPAALLPGLLAQVAGQRAGEQVGALGHTLDLVAQHQGGGLVHPRDAFHRMPALVQRAARLLGRIEAGAGAAHAHVGLAVGPAQRRAGGDGQVDGQRQAGGHHAHPEAATGEGHGQHAVHREGEPGALGQLAQVDLAVALHRWPCAGQPRARR